MRPRLMALLAAVLVLHSIHLPGLHETEGQREGVRATNCCAQRGDAPQIAGSCDCDAPCHPSKPSTHSPACPSCQGFRQLAVSSGSGDLLAGGEPSGWIDLPDACPVLDSFLHAYGARGPPGRGC